MLTGTQLKRYAEVLVWGFRRARRKALKRGGVVRIMYELPGLSLAEAVYEKCVAAGFNPVVRAAETPAMEQSLFRHASKAQLGFISPGTRELYHKLDGSIFIIAPESLTHLKGVDSARIALPMIARKPYRDILFRREEQGDFGWTLCLMPTPVLARAARMSEAAYAREITRACYLDSGDPVAEWERIFKKGVAIKKWLDRMGIKTLRVESPRTDLLVGLGEQRRFCGLSGHNIPSFEIFTSPDWRCTEGIYFSNLPTYRNGNYVEGVRLEFKKGKAVKADAKTGAAFVRKMLAMDAGAPALGEFSLTDRRFSRISRFMAETLFDENFGGRFGNCHVAVGSSYTDTFSGNPARLTPAAKKRLGFNDSSLHWDLVNTEDKRVTAGLKGGGREIIYDHGRFLI